MSNSPNIPHSAVSGGTIGLGTTTKSAAILKRPRTTPTNDPVVDYPSVDSDRVSKMTRPIGISDESVNYPSQNHTQRSYGPDDLPKTVARTLKQGSSAMSMDFHPVQQTILLVGKNVGDIVLWEVGSGERLVLKNFELWDDGTLSIPLQAALLKDPTISVNRIRWSPDGTLFGVAYSRCIVQIYYYHGGNDIRQHLEIDAHVGGVNDLAFSHHNKLLCVVTCGDDKTIKVWDTATGTRQHTFEGHEAPVFSICPHQKKNIQFIFSTALDGKIKAWLYENLESIDYYDAPDQLYITMAYSADGSRLFCCGTSKEGESDIVEWNESEAAVKRIYQGLRKRSSGVVQFDNTRNRFLVVGDGFLIKFWDMDNVNLLTTTDADGGLPATPRIRFNKEGSLLAVSATDNDIKILGNADGLHLLRTFEKSAFDASRVASEDVSTKVTESQMATVATATSSGFADTIPRLIYTNSGVTILALASNAIHLLWKWQQNDCNSSGKATASVPPQLWQPPSGILLMTNDITDTNPEEVVPCFALSKNDS